MCAMRFVMILCMCLGGMLCHAQTPFVYSIEAEYANAIFDPFQGIQLKANHAWQVTEKRAFVSGVSVAGLVRPGSSPTTTGTTDETYLGYKILLHTGLERYWGAKAKGYGLLEGYAGLRGYNVSGSLDQPSQDFTRAYSSHTVRGDIGLRLGIGYRLTEQLGAQLSCTASFIDVGNSLGPWTGVLFWGPDVISTIGIGVNYRL